MMNRSDDLHAEIYQRIKDKIPVNSAIYKTNPSHLHEILKHHGARAERKGLVAAVQDAIDSALPPEPISHAEKNPFSVFEVGMASLMLTAATDAVWAYLTHTGLGFDGEKTDDFWIQTGAQQIYTLLTALVVLPLVMLAVAKKYNKELPEAARLVANVAFSTVGTVTLFNIFAEYGPQLLGLDPTWAFLFPGIIEGPVQAGLLVLGNLITDKSYLFDKIEFAIATSPLSWLFGSAWQGMFQLISGSSIPEPYRTVLVTTLVPIADTLTLYGSLLAINAATDHVKAKHLDAIAQNPEILTKGHRQDNNVPNLTGQVAVPMPSGIVGMLQRLGGSPVHTQPALPGQQTSTLGAAKEIMYKGLGYAARKLFS